MPLSLTVVATVLCLRFAPPPPVIHAGSAPAIAEARARGTLAVVHVASPERPLDAEAAAVFADLRERAAASWSFARVAATDTTSVEALCGERVAVALVVVHPELGPLAAWSGMGSAVLRLLLERIPEQRARCDRIADLPDGSPSRDLELARVRHELASPGLALPALTRAAAPGNPHGVRAAASAAIARCEAEAGAGDRAAAALAACRALDPAAAAAPALGLSEALLASHALAPLRALAVLATLDQRALSSDDRALARLVRADALHQLGRGAESLEVLHDVLADRTALLFHDTALARVAHLLAPDHGHTH